MEKILLISSSSSLENRLGQLGESPRHLARVSSWQETHRLLSKTSPAVVLIDGEMADPSTVSELVRLDNVLVKDDKTAYFLADGDDERIREWTGMFDAVDDLVSPDDDPDRLGELMAEYAADGDDADGEAGDGGGDEPEQVVVRLPETSDGTLGNMSLGRLLYILKVRERTGVLELTGERMDRTFGFQSGQFVEASGHDDRGALTSAFAWPDGSFGFDTGQTPRGSGASTYSLIIEGLSTHRTHRQLMNGLMSRMQAYPVVTQLWDDRREGLDWDILQKFIDQCDGSADLETIFSRLGNEVTSAFQAAAFARDTDLIVFRGEKTAARIEVEYEGDADPDSPATDDPSSASATESESETETDPEKLEAELRSFRDDIESMSAHDIFGIWEGCGREVVKETYYRMVKEHHPDAYGGNVSPEIQEIAQDIFMEIRETYSELLKIEDEQTEPPPRGFDSSKPPRRRRRQMETLHPGQARSPEADGEDDSSTSETAESGEQPTQQPGRQKRNSTPIGLGREPSSAHPDFEQSKHRRERRNKRSSTSTPTSRNSASETSSADSTSDASRSGSGAGDAESDQEWRRERLEKLQRSSSRKKKRRTSSVGGSVSSAGSTGSDGDIPSPSDSKDPEKEAKEAFNSGYKHYKNERYEQALPLFEKAHDLDDDHGLYMTFLANTLFQVEPDDYQRSIDLLEDAIDTGHRQALPDAHLFLGNILKVKDSEHKAYKHFQRALKLNPESRDAQREIRLYERRHGDEEDDEDDSGGFFGKLFKS